MLQNILFYKKCKMLTNSIIKNGMIKISIVILANANKSLPKTNRFL
jgi:hypothetical protein